MDEADDLPFKVGQLAESKSFEKGYRGAWFRCKIKEISRRKGQIGYVLEFYDFSDEAEWTQLYQVPTLGRKAKMFARHLMVRPQYPPMYHESQMSDISSVSEVTVVVEGSWKVGNLVDWQEKDCYWTGRVTKVLDKDKVQIELPMPPAGEGSSYEAFCKDLRPSLDWSPKIGWTVPSLEGGNSCCARLILPMNQDVVKLSNLEIPPMDEGSMDVQAAAGSPFHPSLSSHISANSLPAPSESNTLRQTSKAPLSTTISEDVLEENMDLDAGESAIGKTSSSDSISTSHVRDAVVETSDLCGLPLNSMSANTLEAAILDLEELANKIKWIKAILEFGTPMSNELRPAWRFVDHHASSTPN